MNSNSFGTMALYLTTLPPGERRVVNNLARGLCVVMNIMPEDRQLIPILGLGSEASNGQAVETWILSQLGEHRLSLGPEVFDLLVGLMEQKAMTLSERCV